MYVPRAMVATTITGATAFGARCRSSSRVFPAPSARAACTKSACLTVSTEPRAIRASCGQPSSTMNPTTGHTEPDGTTDRNTRPPSSIGMAKNMSATRESSASHQPPKNPASPPSTPPRSAAPAVAHTPTVTDARAPYTVRAKTSQPWVSKPNG